MANPGYSFELPSEVALRQSYDRPRSINERFGNVNSGTSRAGEKNSVLAQGTFRSWLNLGHAGECIYLCCSTLSGHAVVMPNGLQTVICEIPISGDEEKRYDAIWRRPHLDKLFVDCGGHSLSSLSFSLRDQDGNLVPLGEHNWTATLAFGYVG